jgi:hypothetical protein
MTHLSVVPPSASSWSKVKTVRDFPILAETRQRVRKKMQSSQVNFDDLARIVERDPALCLNLMRAAVAHNPTCREQISGAASCLSLLGMQELVRLIKHLPVVEANAPSRQQQLYRRALHCADMAAEIAAHWAGMRGSVSAGYARWNTLLVCAPLWQWLLSDELAQNWLYCLSEGQDVIPAINSCFGPSQLKNWQQQVKYLNLPPLALDCFRQESGLKPAQWRLLRRHDPRDFDNQRQLMHRLQQPELIPMMATGLAWNWHIGPESKNAQRWLTLASHWLGKPKTQIATELRIIQLNTSRRQRDALSTGLALLASPEVTRMSYPKILPPEHHETAIEPSQADAQEASTASAAITAAATTSTATTSTATTSTPTTSSTTIASDAPIPRQPDGAYLKKLLRQLQQQPDSFGDWHYLMRGVLKGICQGVGLSSACIALLNKDKTALKVFYAEGLPEQALMRRLHIDLRSPSVFNKLLQKPASLQISDSNRARFLKGLPEKVVKVLPPQWVTMSIDAGQQPIGLIIAYNDDGNTAVDHGEYIGFKNLCMTASKSLAELKQQTAARSRQALAAKAPR